MQDCWKITTVAAGLALGAGTASAQGTHVECRASESVCQGVLAYVTANVKPFLSDPVVVNAVKAQDMEHAKINNVEIDKADIGWTERTDKQLIDSKMNNPLSEFLRKKKAAGDGIIFEIFIYDSKGLNVGETDLTQDYYQGDEAKYWKTYGTAPNAIFIDKVEKDHGTNVSQASLTVTDPQSGNAIGAVTVGIDVDKLK